MKKTLACLLALLLALTGAALAEEAALYQSEHGYTLALPDESWFRLDAQTWAQYADTLGEAFAEAGFTAETVETYASTGVEAFFTPGNASASIVVQRQEVSFSDENMRLTLDGLRQLYEGVMGAADYAEVEFTAGEALFEGCEYTLDGLPVMRLYLRFKDRNLSYVLTFQGIEPEAVCALLDVSTFA